MWCTDFMRFLVHLSAELTGHAVSVQEVTHGLCAYLAEALKFCMEFSGQPEMQVIQLIISPKAERDMYVYLGPH